MDRAHRTCHAGSLIIWQRASPPHPQFSSRAIAQVSIRSTLGGPRPPEQSASSAKLAGRLLWAPHLILRFMEFAWPLNQIYVVACISESHSVALTTLGSLWVGQSRRFSGPISGPEINLHQGRLPPGRVQQWCNRRRAGRWWHAAIGPHGLWTCQLLPGSTAARALPMSKDAPRKR